MYKFLPFILLLFFTLDGYTQNNPHHTQKDSIKVGAITLSKADFNKIVDAHPDLFSDSIREPNHSYYDLSKALPYGEMGGDMYFNVYAYFLQKRYNSAAYKEQKAQLKELLDNIIRFEARSKGGGTYFNHEIARLPGIVEYETYALSKGKIPLDKVNFQKGKKEYIAYLNQKMKEASADGFGIQDLIDNGNVKKDDMESLLKLLKDNIIQLITDPFYLYEAQQRM